MFANDGEIIIIRGLPGSGKSTLAHKFRAAGYAHYEADMFMIDHRGIYMYGVDKLAYCHKTCFEYTQAAIKHGMNVVVSNTFTTKKEILPYVELAKKYHARFTVIHCEGSFGSIHNVPEETIRRMKARWENWE